MLDQLFGLLLLGLGLQPPSYPAVKGDETEQATAVDGPTGVSGSVTENENLNRKKYNALPPVERVKNRAALGATGALETLKRLDPEKLKEREEKLKEVFEARREKLKEDLEKRQQASQEKHLKERAGFEKKLKNISDVQKRTIALRVDNKIPELNKRLTTNMTERLSNMQKVLERASLRLAEHKSANTAEDTSGIESEIAAAQATIASALGVVSAQSQKTYTAGSFISEENLGSTMKFLITQFETDIKAARATVNAGKSSVETALKHLGALLGKGEGADKEGE